MPFFSRKNKVLDGGKQTSKQDPTSMLRPGDLTVLQNRHTNVTNQDQYDLEGPLTAMPRPRASFTTADAPNMIQSSASSVYSLPLQAPISPPKKSSLRNKGAKTGSRRILPDSKSLAYGEHAHFEQGSASGPGNATLGHQKSPKFLGDAGYTPTSYSDSGYESSETPLATSEPLIVQTNGIPRLASSEIRSSASPSLRGEASQALISPPLSILEGLKVNTKGRILDEEGDVIGELVEGDILDCVRQKANAHGEVLDDSGRVVGRVITVPRSGGTPSTAQPLSTVSPPGPQAPHVSYTVGSVSPLLLPQLESSVALSAPKSPTLERAAPIPEQQRKQRLGSEASLGALPTAEAPHPSNWPEDRQAKPDTEHHSDASERTWPPLTRHAKSAEVLSASMNPTVSFAEPERTYSVDREIPFSTSVMPSTAAPVSVPALTADVPQQDSENFRRFVPDRSAPGYARSHSRMSINSVLASKTADDSRSVYTPSLFSYKGEIPEADGPQSNIRLRSQGPPVMTMRPLPPALNVKIAHVTSGAGQRHVQLAEGSNNMRPVLGARSSTRSSMRRSPLSGIDVNITSSPNEIDGSPSEDPVSPMSYYSSPPSLYAGRTAHTQSALSGRTYFTHAGRVTVQAEEQSPLPSPTVANPPEPSNQVPAIEPEKKKSRFALFGKKA